MASYRLSRGALAWPRLLVEKAGCRAPGGAGALGVLFAGARAAMVAHMRR